MKKALSILLTIFSVSLGAAQIEDQSYKFKGENIIENVFIVPASIEKVWAAYDNNEGFQSWAAPVASIDWRRGGSIRSSFKVDGKVGDDATTTTYIVNYIPMKEIVFKDNLLDLLEMGIKFGWLQKVPQDFLDELRRDGADIFTTIYFEKISAEQTRLTVINTGYKSGGYWDDVFSNAKSSNQWIFQKLIDRFKNGPVDWSKMK